MGGAAAYERIAGRHTELAYQERRLGHCLNLALTSSYFDCGGGESGMAQRLGRKLIRDEDMYYKNAGERAYRIYKHTCRALRVSEADELARDAYQEGDGEDGTEAGMFTRELFTGRVTAKQVAQLRPMLALIKAWSFAQFHMRFYCKFAMALCIGVAVLFSKQLTRKN